MMSPFVRMLAAVAILPTAASAQVVSSYQSSDQSLMKGDPNKIVCQKQETIGTRLGAKKVCLTISEWNDIAKQNREQTERMQAGVCVPNAGCAADATGEPH